jgi:anti-sigma B factor antagonist
VKLEVTSHKEKGDIAVVTVAGRLTIQHGSRLLEEVKRLAEAGTRQVVVDLSQVSYIDSFGLGQMVGSHTTLRRQGGQVRFAGIQPKIYELIEISGVPKILQWDSDVRAGLAKLTDA